MQYDFLKADKTLSQTQILLFNDINQKLIHLEKNFRNILQTKEFRIATNIRIKLISLLDYFNKIIVFPNSKLNFSYLFFSFYQEVFSLLKEITLNIQFPTLGFSIFPVLNSIYKEIEVLLHSDIYFKNKKRSKQSQICQAKIENLIKSFAILSDLEQKPYEIPKYKRSFHEIPFLIQDTFESFNLDSAVILARFHQLISEIDHLIDNLDLITQTEELIKQTIDLLTNLDDYKRDPKGEIHPEIVLNEPIPFRKKPPLERSIDKPSRSFHTQEMRKSIHSNLVKIIEEDNQKIQQLQEKLSNEIIKNETIEKRKEKLRNHYRKKIQNITNEINEFLGQVDNNIQTEREECLRNKNEELCIENQNLKSQINEINDQVELLEQNVYDLSKKLNHRSQKVDKLKEKIEKLNEEKQLQKETILELHKTIDSLSCELDQSHANETKLIEKEKIFQKGFNALNTYTTKSSNEITKILKSQQKRLDTFEKMIFSQLLINPNAVSQDILQEYSEIKKIMGRNNLHSPEELENFLNQS